MHSTFDTEFYKILNDIGDYVRRLVVIKCCFMWLMNSSDLISGSVCVVDTHDIVRIDWYIF